MRDLQGAQCPVGAQQAQWAGHVASGLWTTFLEAQLKVREFFPRAR
jgi:hypothetical protein